MPAVTVPDITVLPRVPEPGEAAVERTGALGDHRPVRLRGRGLPRAPRVRRHRPARPRPVPDDGPDGRGRVRARRAQGHAWHPHRGFETVTYIMDGTFEHQDSHGGGGVITNGDTQWMTAGGGLLHIERPPESAGRQRRAVPRPAAVGEPAQGRQVARAEVPGPAGAARPPCSPRTTAARCCGSSPVTLAGHTGPGSTFTPMTMIHATVAPGATRAAAVAARLQRAGLRALRRRAPSAPSARPVHTGQSALFGPGDTITVAADAAAGVAAVRHGRRDPRRRADPGADRLGRPVRHEHQGRGDAGVRGLPEGKLGVVPATYVPHGVGGRERLMRESTPEVADAAGARTGSRSASTGALAGFADYRLAPGRITFIHTEIDDAYAGQGLGGRAGAQRAGRRADPRAARGAALPVRQGVDRAPPRLRRPDQRPTGGSGSDGLRNCRSPSVAWSRARRPCPVVPRPGGAAVGGGRRAAGHLVEPGAAHRPAAPVRGAGRRAHRAASRASRRRSRCCCRSRHAGPLASPELVRSRPAARSARAPRPELRPWSVPALVVDPAELADPAESARYGATVAHLRAVAELAADLAARGRVLPTLVTGEAGAVARWRPVVQGVDAVAFDGAGRGAATGRAGRAHRAAGPPGRRRRSARPARRRAGGAGRRRRCATGSPAPSRRWSWPRAGEGPVHAWLAALQRRRSAAGAAARRELATLASTRSRCGTRSATASPSRGGRACGSPRCPRCTIPLDPEPDLADQTGDGTRWQLQFLLQSAADPSLLVPAEQVWSGQADRLLAGPQELLLAELGRAARGRAVAGARAAQGPPAAARPERRGGPPLPHRGRVAAGGGRFRGPAAGQLGRRAPARPAPLRAQHPHRDRWSPAAGSAARSWRRSAGRWPSATTSWARTSWPSWWRRRRHWCGCAASGSASTRSGSAPGWSSCARRPTGPRPPCPPPRSCSRWRTASPRSGRPTVTRAAARHRHPGRRVDRRRAGRTGRAVRHPGGAAGVVPGHAAPVPAARGGVARVPVVAGAGRLPGRRHGAGQDRADAGAGGRRTGRGCAGAHPARLPDVAGRHVAAGVGEVRARAAGLRPPRQRPAARPRADRRAGAAPTWCVTTYGTAARDAEELVGVRLAAARARRGAGDQEPARRARAGGAPLRRRAPGGPDRHPGGEPALGAVVGDGRAQPRPARHPPSGSGSGSPSPSSATATRRRRACCAASPSRTCCAGSRPIPRSSTTCPRRSRSPSTTGSPGSRPRSTARSSTT